MKNIKRYNHKDKRKKLTNGSQNLQLPRTTRASPASLDTITSSIKLNSQFRLRRRRRRRVAPVSLVFPWPPPPPFHHLSWSCSHRRFSDGGFRCGVSAASGGGVRRHLLLVGFWPVLQGGILGMSLVLHESEWDTLWDS